jgi:hypothetical protein
VTPGRYDLEIEQGAVCERTFTYRDADGALVDLTNYTAELVIGTKSSTALTATTDSEITLGGAAGTIHVLLSSVDTGGLTAGRRDYTYRLDLIDATEERTRLLRGTVTVVAETGA